MAGNVGIVQFAALDENETTYLYVVLHYFRPSITYNEDRYILRAFNTCIKGVMECLNVTS